MRKAFLIALMMAGWADLAVAQAPPAPATPPQPAAPSPPDPSCPVVGDGETTQPNRQTADPSSREPLGDKLARSDGVLCPPAGVDPEMRAPPPGAGKTPVIPPPGSPGGDPAIRPK